MAYADLVPDQEKILVKLSWNDKTLAEKIPGGRFRKTDLELPLSWGSCQALRGVFGRNLEIGPGLNAWARQENAKRVAPALKRRDLTEPLTPLPTLSTLPGRIPRPYQQAGVDWMLRAGSGLLADEMGCGKTVQMLEFMSQHTVDAEDFDSWPTNSTLPALVIVPNSTKYHWKRLANIWLPDAVPYVVDGTAPKRAKVLEAAAKNPAALVIVSLEATRALSRLAPYGSTRLRRCQVCDPNHGDEIKPAQCEVHEKGLNAFSFRTVVLDEAHRIKDPSSKQTRAVWHLMHSPYVLHRWALTGTPIANHPGDLWSVMHAVAPEDWPVRTKFLERYALVDWNSFGGMDVVGLEPSTRGEFYRIFDPRFRRMLKSTALPQLPPVTRETRTCELTPAMRRVYTELHDGLATKLDDGTLMVAWNDMVKQSRLAQLSCGSVEIEKPDKDDILSWKITLKEPSPKLDVLEEVLDDLGYTGGDGPAVVVAAEHKQLIDLAAARLAKRGIPYALITGGVAAYERENALDALRQGDIRILLFTIKAGGAGLDMSAADTLVFLQQPWSMVDRLQTEGRVHRFGSEIHDSVRIIDIVTRSTVEEEQIDRVVTKGYRLEEVVRDGEQRAANTAAAVAPAEPEPAVQAPEASAARARAETGPAPAPNPHRPALSTGQPRPSWAGVNPFHGQDAAPESQDDPWAETASRPGAPVPAVLAQEQPLRGVQHDVANGLQQVSASKLRDWTRCRRKWWLTWYRELQLPGNPYGLAAVGTRVHRALAGWYVPDSAGPVPPTDGIELAIKEDWEKIAENLPEDADQREHEYDRWNAAVTLERAMVEGYVQWLEETGADAGLVFTASETELWADISTRAHDGSPLTVRARGKLDARVVREVDGARLFVDHKTVGDLTKPLKTLHMDVQMLHYGLLEWLGTAEGEARCDGALYNMLRRVKRTSSAKPPFYAREDVRHSTVQLEQYRRRMLAAARDMHAAEQRLLAGEDPREVAYPSPGPECAWSCDFFPVCPLFDDGSRADDMLRTVYRADDPWNRYDGLTRKEGTA